MSAWDWIQKQMEVTDISLEMRLTLQGRLNALRAKRRTIDLEVERLMHRIRDLEIERDTICNKEDALADNLERRKHERT